MCDVLDVDYRLHTPCITLTSTFKPDELVVTCDMCGRFYGRCCLHMKAVCHHGRIMYTDGACSNNGQCGAVAGIGIAFGGCTGGLESGDAHQFSIPVDDRLDPGVRRTSQRAELLAALEGLKKICDFEENCMADDSRRCKHHDTYSSLPMIIITTDSEYVAKGMTEWLPAWKQNGLRKANGKPPSNLDLFCKLDAEVRERERRHNCRVCFWHVNRLHNTIADKLAKNGARAAANDVNDAPQEMFC